MKYAINIDNLGFYRFVKSPIVEIPDEETRGEDYKIFDSVTAALNFITEFSRNEILELRKEIEYWENVPFLPKFSNIEDAFLKEQNSSTYKV